MSRAFEIRVGDAPAHTVDVTRHGGRATVTIDGRDYHGSLRSAGDGYELTLEDRTEPMWIVVDGDTVRVHAFGRAWELAVIDPVERERGAGASDDVSVAPMPGTVISIAVAAGQQVGAGEQLLVIESMKMQSEIVAMRDGVVDEVFLTVGDTFDRGAPLVALAAEDGAAEEA